jgi:YidC/Oxa1 family membrane protein insertase
MVRCGADGWALSVCFAATRLAEPALTLFPNQPVVTRFRKVEMERRLLLAILLTFLVLTAYQWFLPKPLPTPIGTPVSAGGAAAAGAAAVAPSSQPVAPMVAPLPPVEALLADTVEKTIAIDNGVVHAVFSNRGATLESWQLSKYRDSAGRPVDLIAHDLPADAPKPFALKLDDAAKTARANGAYYSMTAPAGEAVLNASAAPVTLGFEYQDAAGLHVRKQFKLAPDSYVLDVSTSVMDGTATLNPTIEWGPGLGDVVALAAGGRNVRRAEGIYSIAGKVSRPAASALTTTPHHDGSFDFAGVDTHYFLAAAVKPGPAAIEYHPLPLLVAGSTPPITRDYIAFSIKYPQPPSAAHFYIGPKELQALKAVDPLMVPAIWFGIFSFMSVPLLAALNWLHGFIGNYGWSILALTLIINAVMFPLRHKSFVSMRKMQEIQPQVKMIQDRYAKLKMSDPARSKMNTELMDLYRQKGVNPASGCIPMLLTFPVLLAFYGLLSEAIELRGAPWMFWIKDLSMADPYYVTPILMGLSQLAQQRMAPAAADPAQQKMMMIMPVVFTFLFITSPSGLALYWLASNVLLIGQQSLTNYLIGPPNIRVPRSPAERRLKKVGEGVTDAAESEGKV